MDPVTTPNHDQQATPPAPPEQTQPKKDGGMGPLVGAGIVVILLIFGGLYMWGTMMQEKHNLPADAPTPEEMNVVTPPDESAVIESSLDAFDTASFEAELDAQLQAIEAEL